MKPNYLGKLMSEWPLQKLQRDFKFARADYGTRHHWTVILQQELDRRDKLMAQCLFPTEGEPHVGSTHRSQPDADRDRPRPHHPDRRRGR